MYTSKSKIKRLKCALIFFTNPWKPDELLSCGACLNKVYVCMYVYIVLIKRQTSRMGDSNNFNFLTFELSFWRLLSAFFTF
jgi:hypothetical protein